MSSWARVGVKCVCIKKDKWANGWGEYAPAPCPTFGDECEITSVEPHGGKVFLELKGYPDRWNVIQFRPLVPPKSATLADDVALFKSLLTPAPELVE